jgi:hypothetical protein
MAFKSMFQPITESAAEDYRRQHSYMYYDNDGILDEHAVIEDEEDINEGLGQMIQQGYNGLVGKVDPNLLAQQAWQAAGGDPVNMPAEFPQHFMNAVTKVVQAQNTGQQGQANAAAANNNGTAPGPVQQPTPNVAQNNQAQAQTGTQQPVQAGPVSAPTEGQPVPAGTADGTTSPDRTLVAQNGKWVKAQQTNQAVQQPATQTPVTESHRSHMWNKLGYKLFEEEDASTGKPAESKPTEDKKPEDKKPEDKPAESTAKSETSSSSSVDTNKDFDDAKGLKYDAAYKKDDAESPKGDETVQYKDKIMHDSIFGTGKDIFQDDKEIKYDSAYDNTPDKPTERNQYIKPTTPDPYNPETPKLINMSDPTAMKKTVFTIDNSGIKDSGSSTMKSDGAYSHDKKSEPESPVNKDPKPEKSDAEKSLDSSTNESFYTNWDDFLNESTLDPTLKDTIIQEYFNDNGDDFDLSSFAEWLQQNYPQVASDPNSFDEVSGAIQSGYQIEGDDFDDDLDDDVDDDVDDLDDVDDYDDVDDLDNPDEFDSDNLSQEDDILDIVDEYMSSTMNLDEYDEDDAEAWLRDNYPDKAEDEDFLDDFLDEVLNQFEPDDIDESLDDDFYPFERALND